MDVDTPPPAGVKVESPPSPPPPPPRGNRDVAPPPPPGNPVTRNDDDNYHEMHAKFWHELQGDPVLDNQTRREKIDSFLAWKAERGFIKARDWTKCPFEFYLHQDYPHTFNVKQKDAMYDTFHVNDPHCRAILHHIIEGGICAKRGCSRQIKYGYVHCCVNCSKAPNDVVVTHDFGCTAKNEQRENALAGRLELYRLTKEKRNQRNADLDYAKHPKTEDHNWGTGGSSGSQWQQAPSSTGIEVDMRTAHNKIISNLVPVGGSLISANSSHPNYSFSRATSSHSNHSLSRFDRTCYWGPFLGARITEH